MISAPNLKEIYEVRQICSCKNKIAFLSRELCNSSGSAVRTIRMLPVNTARASLSCSNVVLGRAPRDNGC